MRFTKTLKQVLGSLRRRAGVAETKAAAPAAFELRYGGLRVGTLTFSNGKWTFWYSEEFRNSRDVRPLVQFADVNRIYRSERLWPFFLLRIPSMIQSDVQEALKHEHIDATDEVALLRRFGKRTIANPFELIEVEAGDLPAPPSPFSAPKVPEPIAS